MAELKYPSAVEFIELYKKFPGGTDAEFATFLETEGYGNFKGLKYNIKDLEAKRRTHNLKSKADYFRTRKSLLAEAKELGVTQFKGKPLNKLTQNELNRALGDKRGVETKKLRRLTEPGFAEKDVKAKQAWKERNPEKVKSINLASRQKKAALQRIPPPAETAEQALFRDLWITARGEKGTLKLKPINKNINIFEAKNFYSNKNQIIDTKNKIRYNFNNFEKALNKKNVGYSFENIIEPFRQKYFIAKQGLRTQINSKMLPGWDASKKTNYFEVQHVEGRNVNPYNVHLTTGKPNKLEGKFRTRFEKAWDLAKKQKLKNKNFNLLDAQKNALKMFTDSMANVEGIASQPSMITRTREFGERLPLDTMLRDVKKEGVTLPRGILKVIKENAVSNATTNKYNICSIFGKASGGTVGGGCARQMEFAFDNAPEQTLNDIGKLNDPKLKTFAQRALSLFPKLGTPGKIAAGAVAGAAAIGALTYNKELGEFVNPLNDDKASQATVTEWIKDNPVKTVAGTSIGFSTQEIPGAYKKARELGRGRVRSALGITGALKPVLTTFGTPAMTALFEAPFAAKRLEEGETMTEVLTDPLGPTLGLSLMETLSQKAGVVRDAPKRTMLEGAKNYFNLSNVGTARPGVTSKILRMGMSPRMIAGASRFLGLPGLALSLGLTGYGAYKNYQNEEGMLYNLFNKDE